MTLVQLHETGIESDVIVVTTFRYASMVHHADEFFLVAFFLLALRYLKGYTSTTLLSVHYRP